MQTDSRRILPVVVPPKIDGNFGGPPPQPSPADVTLQFSGLLNAHEIVNFS